jgi:hypothetical protein
VRTVTYSALIATAGSWARTGFLEIHDPTWLPNAAKESVAALQDGDLPSPTRHLRD